MICGEVCPADPDQVCQRKPHPENVPHAAPVVPQANLSERRRSFKARLVWEWGGHADLVPYQSSYRPPDFQRRRVS